MGPVWLGWLLVGWLLWDRWSRVGNGGPFWFVLKTLVGSGGGGGDGNFGVK